MTDWGDANTILLGLVSVGQYDHKIKLIETVPSSIESVNYVKHIAYIQSVRAKILKMYTDTHAKRIHYKNIMASLRYKNNNSAQNTRMILKGTKIKCFKDSSRV